MKYQCVLHVWQVQPGQRHSRNTPGPRPALVMVVVDASAEVVGYVETAGEAVAKVGDSVLV